MFELNFQTHIKPVEIKNGPKVFYSKNGMWQFSAMIAAVSHRDKISIYKNETYELKWSFGYI